MIQFLGEFDVPVDEKGRIFFPAELRRKLPPETEDAFVVVKGLDGCLTAYPQHAWDDIAAKLMRLPQTDPKVRVFIRGMLSQAAEVKLDRQGRANLPRKLLERVGITDRVVVIGALDKIEFWNPAAWGQFMQQADSELEGVAAGLQL
ncbi:MAG: division/cell wall cluster transcriptional repressor MraZ [Candidatus Handelsmanbacteria bacterium]|nr:division/cell wall cluster transcriptional repressor MraZ [Candidatus Handelsmanbacteria bacterium]